MIRQRGASMSIQIECKTYASCDTPSCFEVCLPCSEAAVHLHTKSSNYEIYCSPGAGDGLCAEV